MEPFFRELTKQDKREDCRSKLRKFWFRRWTSPSCSFLNSRPRINPTANRGSPSDTKLPRENRQKPQQQRRITSDARRLGSSSVLSFLALPQTPSFKLIPCRRQQSSGSSSSSSRGQTLPHKQAPNRSWTIKSLCPLVLFLPWLGFHEACTNFFPEPFADKILLANNFV